MTELAATRDKATVVTEIKKTTTITLEAEQITAILLKHFNAPMGLSNEAKVEYDCGSDYEFLDHATISWVEKETK